MFLSTLVWYPKADKIEHNTFFSEAYSAYTISEPEFNVATQQYPIFENQCTYQKNSFKLIHLPRNWIAFVIPFKAAMDAYKNFQSKMISIFQSALKKIQVNLE